MSLPVDDLKQTLIAKGLEGVQISPQRLPDGHTLFNIRVRFRPDQYIPIEEAKVHHVPVAAKGKEELADKGIDDLTVIPGIGPTTCSKLHAAGFYTFADLDAASDAALLQVVNPATLEKIRGRI